MIGRKRRSGASPEEWRHRFWPAPSIDRFVVSYPKAGRTWVRVMLAVVEAGAIGTRPEPVVDEWLRNDAPSLAGSRVLSTHALATSSEDPPNATDLFLRYVAGNSRVFLVRDPRDVIVSYFFQLTKRAGRRAQDLASAGEFARDPGRGIDRILRFMRARDRSLREDPGPTLLLSYEGLHRDPQARLEAVLRFLGVPVETEAVLAAVEFEHFDDMQRLEREGASATRNRRLTPRDPGDRDSFKTRRGEVGGYVDYLSPDDVPYVEDRIAALQPRSLGYLEPGVAPDVAGAPR